MSMVTSSVAIKTTTIYILKKTYYKISCIRYYTYIYIRYFGIRQFYSCETSSLLVLLNIMST